MSETKILKDTVVEKEKISTPNNNGNQPKSRRDILRTLRQRPWLLGGLIGIVAIAIFIGIEYLLYLQSVVYIENSEIYAPIISLSPEAPGILDEIYVKEGDSVSADQDLAKVGGQLIRSKTAGIIVSIQNTPGQMVGPQNPVIQMVDPTSLRVIGHIEEDKGLSAIRVGQRVMFTVDAFGSKQYQGTVESIGETADQSDVVFSISDKRQERTFDVKVDFDINAYPELKNGMSAKMWVYKY
jgi:multidrug resistance efflux pump